MATCKVCGDTGWEVWRTRLAPSPVARGESVLVPGLPLVVPCGMHPPFCPAGERTRGLPRSEYPTVAGAEALRA
jgi:hypothetical protein